MKTKSLIFCLLVSLAVFFSSCSETEDPGPLQEVERQFYEEDFDRVEIGDAMQIKVRQGNYFEIAVRGDRRNVDDLDVSKEGSTLIVRFDENRNRRHETYVTITMPSLTGINFSGASNSVVTGFDALDALDLVLSGASTCQIDANILDLSAVVSGASVLTLRGEGDMFTSQLSGASILRAFDFEVNSMDVVASGASSVKIFVNDNLRAVASGASAILYRGTPSVDAEVLDTSVVRQD